MVYRLRCRLGKKTPVQFGSVAQSCPTLWPHRLQHARLPCPSLSPGVYPNSCPMSQWCHPTISSSVTPFSSCLQSSPASGSFPVSQLFTWGGQRIGASLCWGHLYKRVRGFDWGHQLICCRLCTSMLYTQEPMGAFTWMLRDVWVIYSFSTLRIWEILTCRRCWWGWWWGSGFSGHPREVKQFH